ncbi:MAG: hypothetical protein DI598_15310 [Pseudopedobacter saltans]|uniref:Glycosyl transferase family 9 n=1 Tax=Pseudopedobacter saltans TaxID=151895 RepID=A0A2W5GP59_9SPHI|nr:MAG: hypothetical protein DI598_15310 [Pseudopedobacter saltans]
MITRFISVLVRRNKERKSYKKLLKFVEGVMREIDEIPKNSFAADVVMVVRMDDIGDYILSRNLLPTIKNAEKFRGQKIVYVGNSIYKDLAEVLDKDYIDSFIWVDQKLFHEDASYRKKLFKELRNRAPSTVIELERTPNVNYGDLIVHAAHAPVRYGSANYYQQDLLNELSNSFYSHIFERDWNLTHEFVFNQAYVNWICDTSTHLDKPSIDIGKLPIIKSEYPYILCVIGSSKKSKNWPLGHWVQLLKKLSQIFDGKIMLIGGAREIAFSKKIIDQNISPNIISIVGKTTLMEAFAWIKKARLMVSNDTFAIHAGVAMDGPPTVVMANGESAFRFSELSTYSSKYRVVYSSVYGKRLPNMKPKDRWFLSLPSVDMATITVDSVFKNCQELFRIESGEQGG